ncbi:DODA-type extradiol aromatic ring-opening family dioxygenase [Laspinema palackyanum]|uniref:DODA-type extradiol aromatic ring-opening family dioxygenase n=1 Tax=Laspinema palackyanum TaxID=3231601 RepID=UPI00345DB2C8
MDSLPTLFISHGAPDLPLQDGAVTAFLKSLHQHFPKPKAILVISAHWYSAMPTVSTAVAPRTIHDFSGFPAALYKLNYPAPGSPELGDRVVTLLKQAGIPCQTDSARGFDHGTWTPLMVAYPAADIPVVQLSIQYYRDATYHWQLGQALEPLRQEGVLIIGSGSATHNLHAFSAQYDAAPPSWVQQFDVWLREAIAQQDWQRLMQYRQLAPYAHENHPTEEHLLPLFVALGAAGSQAKGIQLHQSYTYGAFSMAAYAFTSLNFH